MMTITYFISPEQPKFVTSVNPQANEDYLQGILKRKKKETNKKNKRKQTNTQQWYQ